ncbi:MAG: Panacea domain-containing protein [Pyrinomonadaceae bacterium]
MAFDVRSVANALLKLAKARGISLTNMQVQKLVYIAHGYSLAILHRPLVRQPVEAWRWGPVFEDLYHSLKRYGSGIVHEPINVINMDSLTETHQKLLGTVLDAYARFSGPQLSTMTHKQGTPWAEVYKPGISRLVIPNPTIERHYTELLNARKGIAAD